MKRILSLILASLLLAASVSCSDAPQTEDTEPAQESASESAAETVSPEDDKYAYAKEKYNAIPQYNLDGADFTIATQSGITSGGYTTEQEVTSDGLNGQGINDAIYLRTEAVNERFNCKIQRTDTHVDEAVKQAVTAGDTTLKLAFPSLARVDMLAVEGYLVDLFNASNLNLEEAWYDKGSFDLQLFGKLYGITGDINFIDDLLTSVILFSKDLMEQHQLGNMYDIVNEGKWTLDTMMTLADVVGNDVDGNGRYDASDAYGYIRWVTYDKEGYPQVTIDTERAISLLEKTQSFFKGNSWAWAYDNIHNIFKANRALFFADYAGVVINLGDMEYDYGIIPPPKYDEVQDQYYSYPFTMIPCVSIPNNGNNVDQVSAVMEALAIQSHMLLKPEVYDQALTRRYSRDEESSAMLDLIFENRIYDYGEFYAGFDGFFGKMVLDGTTNFASRFAKKKPTAEAKIEEFVNMVLDN